MGSLMPGLVDAYVDAIFVFGTKEYDQILPAYVDAVKQRAAEIFTDEQLSYYLYKKNITQDEYDEIMRIKHPIIDKPETPEEEPAEETITDPEPVPEQPTRIQ